MGRSSVSMVAIATRWTIAISCGLITLAGCDSRPAPRSLKDETSIFRVKVDAPESRFAPAGGGEGLAAGGPESSFGEPAAPGSTFRAAEVPPDKLEATEALISGLKARQTADQSIVVDLPADVLFDFDKAELRPDAQEPLSRATRLVESYPDAPLAVNGHTDGKGTDAYNDPLSQRRARAVADWLKAKTGRAAEAKGLGKRQPIAANVHPDGSDDPDGRQRNRRVEILIRPLPAAR
ncbi:MAG: OmpA family protein [Sphingomonas bacterium]